MLVLRWVWILFCKLIYRFNILLCNLVYFILPTLSRCLSWPGQLGSEVHAAWATLRYIYPFPFISRRILVECYLSFSIFIYFSCTVGSKRMIFDDVVAKAYVYSDTWRSSFFLCFVFLYHFSHSSIAVPFCFLFFMFLIVLMIIGSVSIRHFPIDYTGCPILTLSSCLKKN